MPRHGRPAPAAIWWLAGWLALTCPSAARAGKPPDQTHLADASLHSITAVNAQTLWAVGDRGAIWHTADAGLTWELQSSGVDNTLRCVQFIDRDHGFAAGGFQRPHSRTSVGVLLRTADGGRSWQRVEQPLLPALRCIRFFDADNGWALGENTDTFATGLFATDDGGRSWAPISASDGNHWQAIDFAHPHFGALAGARGQTSILRR
ncbi:MAG TPA: hypothetical protein VHY20_08665, partial [Pirellulales bacterium]|nr:hypothetical protein [Pirellulales bacterium]